MLPCPIKSFGEKNPFLHKITFFIEKKKKKPFLDIFYLGKWSLIFCYIFFPIALEAKKKKEKKKRGVGC